MWANVRAPGSRSPQPGPSGSNPKFVRCGNSSGTEPGATGRWRRLGWWEPAQGDMLMTMAAPPDLHFLQLHEISHLIRTRTLSSREVTEAMLARIDDLEPGLRAFATVIAESALV